MTASAAKSVVNFGVVSLRIVNFIVISPRLFTIVFLCFFPRQKLAQTAKFERASTDKNTSLSGEA